MVEITTIEAPRKWRTTRAILKHEDISEDHVDTLLKVAKARKWIAEQGYHLRIDDGYAAIRLEKNSYTIIDVIYRDWVYVDGHPEFVSTCVVYAAMLLYRRLKRDKVIA